MENVCKQLHLQNLNRKYTLPFFIAAAVLQMLSHAITEEAFRAGLYKYINEMYVPII